MKPSKKEAKKICKIVNKYNLWKFADDFGIINFRADIVGTKEACLVIPTPGTTRGNFGSEHVIFMKVKHYKLLQKAGLLSVVSPQTTE